MICRLCLRKKEQCIGFFDEKGISMQTSKIISKHFWFEPKIDDEYPQNICEKCWSFVFDFNNFYCFVKDVHKNIENFKNNNNMVRKTSDIGTKYNLGNKIVSSIDQSLEENSKNLREEKANPENKLQNQEYQVILTKLESKIFQNELEDKKIQITFGNTKRKILNTDDEIAKLKILNCNICLQKYAKFSELKKHMSDIHGENGYVLCCEKKFYKRYKFVNHLQMHFNPEEFKCSYCEKKLGSKKYVKLHIKNLHTEFGKMKKFSCNQCEKSFAQKAYLTRHKLSHVPDSEKDFACDSCGNKYPTPALLRIHSANVHNSKYSAICDLCGKKYKSPAVLKRHRLEHIGIREPKVQCDTCGDWLSNKYKLKRHMIKHTSANIEHRCNICNKISTNLLALKSHMRLHNAVRKFKCNICEKGFHRNINLKEHMTTHTGEALYSCPNCARTFTHHSNLHHHRKKIHQKELEEEKALKNTNLEISNNKSILS